MNLWTAKGSPVEAYEAVLAAHRRRAEAAVGQEGHAACHYDAAAAALAGVLGHSASGHRSILVLV